MGEITLTTILLQEMKWFLLDENWIYRSAEVASLWFQQIQQVSRFINESVTLAIGFSGGSFL